MSRHYRDDPTDAYRGEGEPPHFVAWIVAIIVGAVMLGQCARALGMEQECRGVYDRSGQCVEYPTDY